MPERIKPLEGYRVLDLSTYAAAPICAMTLADWGADVIKVEPLTGDAYRFFGPVMYCKATDDDNIQFELDNRNKRGVALDLKDTRGQEVFYKLLDTSDVLVTNYRPMALINLKITYDELKEKYPKLIYAYLNGYGDKGPEKNKPGFDYAAYWARGGILEEIGEPESEPVQAMAGFGDHPTGTILAGGICAALLRREKTGRGCKVQTSLYSTAIWNLSLNIASANNSNGYKKSSRKFPKSALLNNYLTADGRWITVIVLEYERYFNRFCDIVIEKPELKNHPRFSTQAEAFKNSRELTEIIEKEFIKHHKDELVRRLKKADIVYEVNLRFHEIKEDSQALDNGYILEFTLPSGRKDWTVGNPVKFDGQNTDLVRYAPRLGEHNDEIIQELGFTYNEIYELRKEGIIK